MNEFNEEQYDRLILNYTQDIVDGMDMDSLVQFASDMIESNLRENFPSFNELVEEISRIYDEDIAKQMVESL